MLDDRPRKEQKHASREGKRGSEKRGWTHYDGSETPSVEEVGVRGQVERESWQSFVSLGP